MKAYINKESVIAHQGIGNKSVTLLASDLMTQGHSVVNDLSDLSSDVDITFCLDSSPSDKSAWFEEFLNNTKDD